MAHTSLRFQFQVLSLVKIEDQSKCLQIVSVTTIVPHLSSGLLQLCVQYVVVVLYSCRIWEQHYLYPPITCWHTHNSVVSGSGCIQKVVVRSQCLMQLLESLSSGSAGEGKGEVDRGRDMEKRGDRK